MKNSIKTVGSIFFIIFFSKLLGQLREIMIAGSYGTGATASAFTTATQIPLNFFDIILGAAIVSAFVPVFNEYLKKDGFEEANRFANHFIGIVFLISFAVSVLGSIGSGLIIGLISSGLSGETKLLASVLLRIMFPSMILTAIAYAFAGILQSCGEFKAPAAMSVVSNGVSILYLLFLNKQFGIYGLAWSMLAGWALQIVILLPYLIRFRYHFGLSFHFLHPGMIKVYKLVLPIMLSSWGQPLNVVFNIHFASFVSGDSGVAAINYANRLYLIIASVFTLAVTNFTLPSLSRMHVAGEQKEAGDMITSSLKAVILFLMPVMGMFIIFRVPIIQIIYERGAFDAVSTTLTASALLFYSFGMLGYGVQEVLNKSFYAMQKSVVPMRTTFLTVGVNIVLSYLLYRPLGIAGLAMAASVAATVGGIALFFQIRRYNAYVDAKGFVIIIAKSFVAAIVSCGSANAIYQSFGAWGSTPIKKFALLCIVGVICVLLYLALLLLFRVKEIAMLKKLLKREDSDH